MLVGTSGSQQYGPRRRWLVRGWSRLGGTTGVSGNSVTGGVNGGGANPSGGPFNGKTYGAGILQGRSSTLTFVPGAGATQALADAIADQTGSVPDTGEPGSIGLVKRGDGRLVLSGTNVYSGGTTVSPGVLSISADPNLGKHRSHRGWQALCGLDRRGGPVRARREAAHGGRQRHLDRRGWNRRRDRRVAGQDRQRHLGPPRHRHLHGGHNGQRRHPGRPCRQLRQRHHRQQRRAADRAARRCDPCQHHHRQRCPDQDRCRHLDPRRRRRRRRRQHLRLHRRHALRRGRGVRVQQHQPGRRHRQPHLHPRQRHHRQRHHDQDRCRHAGWQRRQLRQRRHRQQRRAAHRSAQRRHPCQHRYRQRHLDPHRCQQLQRRHRPEARWPRRGQQQRPRQRRARHARRHHIKLRGRWPHARQAC